MVQTNQRPDDWRTELVLMMFKTGDTKDPDNYRVINLLSSTLELTTRIMAEKMR